MQLRLRLRPQEPVRTDRWVATGKDRRLVHTGHTSAGGKQLERVVDSCGSRLEECCRSDIRIPMHGRLPLSSSRRGLGRICVSGSWRGYRIVLVNGSSPLLPGSVTCSIRGFSLAARECNL